MNEVMPVARSTDPPSAVGTWLTMPLRLSVIEVPESTLVSRSMWRPVARNLPSSKNVRTWLPPMRVPWSVKAGERRRQRADLLWA